MPRDLLAAIDLKTGFWRGWRRAAALAVVLAVLAPAAYEGNALAQEVTLRLGTAFREPMANTDQTGFATQVTREAFHRLGIDVTVVQLPAERALVNANRGTDDGDLLRIGGLTDMYPNLRQAAEKTNNQEFVVFTKKANFLPAGWESLKPYHVGFLTGWKILEKNVTQAKSVTKVSSVKQMFALLQSNRVDVIIFSKWSGLHYIKTNGLKDIHPLEPPLAVREMFLYLHKKHEYLIPLFSAALRQVKEDGTYDRILQATLAPLLASR